VVNETEVNPFVHRPKIAKDGVPDIPDVLRDGSFGKCRLEEVVIIDPAGEAVSAGIYPLFGFLETATAGEHNVRRPQQVILELLDIAGGRPESAEEVHAVIDEFFVMKHLHLLDEGGIIQPQVDVPEFKAAGEERGGKRRQENCHGVQKADAARKGEKWHGHIMQVFVITPDIILYATAEQVAEKFLRGTMGNIDDLVLL
jgi:hypothetical protein